MRGKLNIFALSNVQNCPFRKATCSNLDQWQLSVKYSKLEYIGSIINFVSSMSTISFTMFGNLFYQFNQYRLPYTFYIIWLPFDGTSINWILNYIHQVTVLFFGGLLFLMYFIVTLIFMNHCCWGLDILILLVEDLGRVINSNEVEISSCKDLIGQRLRGIVDMSYKVIQWRNDVQDFLKYSFLTEFSLMSVILCLCIYNIVSSPFESLFAPMTLSISFFQLFITCWMGNRVIERIEKLVASLYSINWYLIQVKHQKDIQMIMMMGQSMKGFNGIFKDVSMPTFQRVRILKLCYFTLLRFFFCRFWI